MNIALILIFLILLFFGRTIILQKKKIAEADFQIKILTSYLGGFIRYINKEELEIGLEFLREIDRERKGNDTTAKKTEHLSGYIKKELYSELFTKEEMDRIFSNQKKVLFNVRSEGAFNKVLNIVREKTL